MISSFEIQPKGNVSQNDKNCMILWPNILEFDAFPENDRLQWKLSRFLSFKFSKGIDYSIKPHFIEQEHTKNDLMKFYKKIAEAKCMGSIVSWELRYTILRRYQQKQ